MCESIDCRIVLQKVLKVTKEVSLKAVAFLPFHGQNVAITFDIKHTRVNTTLNENKARINENLK